MTHGATKSHRCDSVNVLSPEQQGHAVVTRTHKELWIAGHLEIRDDMLWKDQAR